jgi:hypothetical protein
MEVGRTLVLSPSTYILKRLLVTLKKNNEKQAIRTVSRQTIVPNTRRDTMLLAMFLRQWQIAQSGKRLRRGAKVLIEMATLESGSSSFGYAPQ